VAQGKLYVDDLYSKKALEPLPEDDFSPFRLSGHGGLSFHEHESTEFRELFNHLQDKRQVADEDRYANRAGMLLKEMKTDVELFFRRVCSTNSPDNTYAHVPILGAISPDTFCKAMLRLHPAAQRVVFYALKSRYEHGQLNRELQSEADWVREV
jgi:hypothetical protein